jgi:protease I
MSTVKILLIIASRGFQDEEYRVTREILERAGLTVLVASTVSGRALGKMGLSVAIDLALSDIKISDYGSLVFIGGPGAEAYKSNATVLSLVRAAVAEGKVLAAICIAPLILGGAGILTGKKATVWVDGIANETAKELERSGAKYTGEDVTVDGKIITANGPAAAVQFATAIIREL